MLQQIVVIPTYKREPLLHLCLEAIRKQRSIIPIFVFSDRGEGSAELSGTCALFGAQMNVRPPHRYYGNSWNVLTALQWDVIAWPDSIINFVEDDTIVYPGYFDWVQRKLESERYGVALGRLPGDRDSTWYESPCASWRSGALKKCLELIPPGYFAETREEMQKALDVAFAGSKFKYGSAEQDGFFLRALEKLQIKTAFPDVCYASHIGSWGYNRPGGWEPTGTFEEKVAQCRKLLLDRTRRYELFGKGITDREMEGMK